MTIDVRPPSGIWHPGYISGRYYGSWPATVANTVSVADTIYLAPLPIYRPVSIANVVFNETAAATVSQHARGAIYADAGGLPAGAPLREGAAALDLVTNGIAAGDIALTSALSVGIGIIWIAIWFETNGGTAASFGRMSNTGCNSIVMGATSAIGCVGASNNTSYGYTMTSAYGASFPTLSGLSATIVAPLVGFKAA